MLKAIFFARFHPERGPIIRHQVPSGSIVPSPSSSSTSASTTLPTAQPPLFDFHAISEYIIPSQQFCDQLMTICINGYRVIGYPVCITNPQYTRNEYIFNLAVVVEDGAGDVSAYVGVVRKMARLFRELEVQSGFLSGAERAEQEESGGEGEDEVDAERMEGGGKVYALCEMVLEDLNNYCECMIPIDESNTLNLKLFPTYPIPPPVKAWHVPLPMVNLSSMTDSTWDLTMLRIIPYVNGVHSVRNIALLAAADYNLTQKAVRHLLYYGCILLLDIFHFSAIYAPTAEIEVFFTDTTMQLECARYVTTTGQPVETDKLLKLYARLRQSLNVADWCMANADCLQGVDVRRMLTFGVIKGFLYRVHKYAIAKDPTEPLYATHGERTKSAETLSINQDGRKEGSTRKSLATNESTEEDVSMMRFLDGTHCFDEICTELQLTEPELLEKIKRIGDVHVIHR